MEARSAAGAPRVIPWRRLFPVATAETARLFALILAVDLAVLLLHVLNRVGGLDKRLLDLDLEGNLPTWLSSIQFFGVALCAALLSQYVSGRRAVAWRGFALLFVFLSIDESAQIHEHIVDRVATSPEGDAWFWPVFYIPIGVAVLVALWAVLDDIRLYAGSALPAVLSLGLLGAAVGLDAAATQFVEEPWLFEPELVLEEGAELLGTAVLIVLVLGIFLARLKESRRV
jgi:hypothetical protein